MKKSLIALTLATSLAAAGATGAAAMQMEFNMLTGAVYNALRAQGFDTTNIDQLTLSEIAVIQDLLENQDMNSSARNQIKTILTK